MKKVLLLIDVQYGYIQSAHSKPLDYIHKIIEEYSKKNLPIMSLSFDDPLGKTTIASVRKKLKKIKGVWYLNKSHTSGAYEVEEALSLRGFGHGSVRIDVCGFNTDMCVLQTVRDLKKRGHKIAVHSAGTGSYDLMAHNSGIKRIKKMGIKTV